MNANVNANLCDTEDGCIEGSKGGTVGPPWIEKYRPSNFQDIVLDPLNRELFQTCLNRNYFPNFLFYGPPGTGKTTTIINLIQEYQTRYQGHVSHCNVIHLNASDERGIDIIRYQIHPFVRANGLFETGMKFVVLDEVDYMTKNAQQALKCILQTDLPHVRFCLICNYITKIDEALKNELMCVRFNQLPNAQIDSFIASIAETEGLTVTAQTMEALRALHGSDMRSMINHIQLYQGEFLVQETAQPRVLDGRVLDQLKALFHGGSARDIRFMLHRLSGEYNMDPKSILLKYINHMIRHYPREITETFLNRVEIVLHVCGGASSSLDAAAFMLRGGGGGGGERAPHVKLKIF